VLEFLEFFESGVYVRADDHGNLRHFVQHGGLFGGLQVAHQHDDIGAARQFRSQLPHRFHRRQRVPGPSFTGAS